MFDTCSRKNRPRRGAIANTGSALVFRLWCRLALTLFLLTCGAGCRDDLGAVDAGVGGDGALDAVALRDGPGDGSGAAEGGGDGLRDAAAKDGQDDFAGQGDGAQDGAPPGRDGINTDGAAPGGGWVIFAGGDSGWATVWAVSASATQVALGAVYGGSLNFGGKVLSGHTSLLAALTPGGAVSWVQGRTAASVVSVTFAAAGTILTGGLLRQPATIGTTSLTPVGGIDGYWSAVDPLGVVLDAEALGGTQDDSILNIAPGPGGRFYVAGLFQGTAQFGTTSLTSAGNSDVFLAQVDAAGTVQWAISMGGAKTELAQGLDVDGQGAARVALLATGAVKVGASTVTPRWSRAVVVAKVDATGKVVWTTQLDAESIIGAGVAVDAAGDTVATGAFGGALQSGSVQLSAPGAPKQTTWVVRLDGAGKAVWGVADGVSTSATGGGGSRVQDLALDARGDAIITGGFMQASFTQAPLQWRGLGDVFVARIDRNGTWRNTLSAGGSYDDGGMAVAVDPGGNVYVGGTAKFDNRYPPGSGRITKDTVTFGATQTVLNGQEHGFVWKIPAGSL